MLQTSEGINSRNTVNEFAYFTYTCNFVKSYVEILESNSRFTVSFTSISHYE